MSWWRHDVIPVVKIARDELIRIAQFAGVSIQDDKRIGAACIADEH